MATIDALRDLLWERDAGTCGICCQRVERAEMHIDHIVARSQGGLDKFDNLQPAHMVCNIRKRQVWDAQHAFIVHVRMIVTRARKRPGAGQPVGKGAIS